MDNTILLELEELISESFNIQQIRELGKEFDESFNLEKIAGLSLGMRIRNTQQGSKILVDFYKKSKLKQLIERVIEYDQRKLAGKEVKLHNIDKFLAKLTHFGFFYDHLKHTLEKFDGEPHQLDNWGILKEGELYELAFISIDIVGNTKLQKSFSKEEIEKVYKEFQNYVYNGVTKFNGKVWNWAGDGGLCAFYTDNKAESAIRAAIYLLLNMVLFNDIENTLGVSINIRLAVDRGNTIYKVDKGSIFSETINYVCHLEKNGTDVNSISITVEVYEALSQYLKRFFTESGKFEDKVVYKFQLENAFGSKKNLF